MQLFQAALRNHRRRPGSYYPLEAMAAALEISTDAAVVDVLSENNKKQH